MRQATRVAKNAFIFFFYVCFFMCLLFYYGLWGFSSIQTGIFRRLLACLLTFEFAGLVVMPSSA